MRSALHCSDRGTYSHRRDGTLSVDQSKSSISGSSRVSPSISRRLSKVAVSADCTTNSSEGFLVRKGLGHAG